MLRFLTLSVLILKTAGKLYSNIYDHVENDVQPRSLKPPFQIEFVNRGLPLWVLSLSGNDWMVPKLRLGNTAELEEFFDYVTPLIRRQRGPPLRVKKDDPNRSSSTVDLYDLSQKSLNEVRNDFMLMINKFALSSSLDPDSYITGNAHDNDDSPSISLHFKGPYSVLIVELDNKQWHYFINSRSSLPEWFYEYHDTRESPIQIPEDVKTELFGSLWRLLHVFFGLPV